ncbi:MAG: DUF3794 domain-containing protein [Clostridia bacterium]|nr:DUF3794 domain-containing protein [Clostridia bacterium]
MENQYTSSEQICTLLYNGTHNTEAQGDFSLPDYLPDVRKVLRVMAEPHVTSRYLNGDRLEMEGNVNASFLYMADDNSIHCFSASLPFSQNIAIAGLDENTVITVKQNTENASCRLQGPRKCTLRCKLRSSVRALTERSIRPDISSLALTGEEPLCTHTVTHPTCMLLCASTDDLRYAEDLPTGNQSIQEVLTCRVTPVISEARGGDHCVVCKGEYLIEAFCSFLDGSGNDDAISYHTLKRRIPFSETLECSGLSDAFRCEPDLTVTSVIPSITEEGRNLGVDFSAECSVVCAMDTEAAVITDAFLPSYDVRITGEDVQSFLPVRMTTGNFSAAGTIKAEAGETVTEITDVVMAPTLDHTECTDGRLVLTGNMEISAIAKTDDQKYLPITGSIPLRWETDGSFDQNTACSSDNAVLTINECKVLSCTARPDQDQKSFSCEAELQVFLSVARREALTLPHDITVPGEAKKIAPPAYSVVLCYPQAEESLWDIAKHYRVTKETLCRCNHLPENTEIVPSETKVLLIPTSDLFEEAAAAR